VDDTNYPGIDTSIWPTSLPNSQPSTTLGGVGRWEHRGRCSKLRLRESHHGLPSAHAVARDAAGGVGGE